MDLAYGMRGKDRASFRSPWVVGPDGGGLRAGQGCSARGLGSAGFLGWEWLPGGHELGTSGMYLVLVAAAAAASAGIGYTVLTGAQVGIFQVAIVWGVALIASISFVQNSCSRL